MTSSTVLPTPMEGPTEETSEDFLHKLPAQKHEMSDSSGCGLKHALPFHDQLLSMVKHELTNFQVQLQEQFQKQERMLESIVELHQLRGMKPADVRFGNDAGLEEVRESTDMEFNYVHPRTSVHSK
ncbi:unnamed protein product [Polarella glacialis]|uniref:Uncharacterized protein n=2 Tax=Polarella glacialis TaxID=89957 RepID=A0A813LST1_POLGL|nr:unnamed protein product [Polarella glacialis]